ncbi:MAG: hypothetical protein H0U70_09705 [Tatlockia sp.]|nr:hypothetical protein [Tatlockia sp.]
MSLLRSMNKMGLGLIFLCFFTTAQARLPVWIFSHDTTPTLVLVMPVVAVLTLT